MIRSMVGIGRDQMKMDHARAMRDWVQSHPDIGAIFLAAVGANWKALSQTPSASSAAAFTASSPNPPPHQSSLRLQSKSQRLASVVA
jgi:hypothetical protein